MISPLEGGWRLIKSPDPSSSLTPWALGAGGSTSRPRFRPARQAEAISILGISMTPCLGGQTPTPARLPPAWPSSPCCLGWPGPWAGPGARPVLPVGPHPGSLTRRQSLEMEGPAPDGPRTALSLQNRTRHTCQPRRGGQDPPREKGSISVRGLRVPAEAPSDTHSNPHASLLPFGTSSMWPPVQLCAHQCFSHNIPS